MDKPDFEKIIQELEQNSQNLKDNNQIGNSKLILAFAELIRVMAWSSSQQDTNNIQVANLTEEIKDLKINIKKYSTSADKESKSMRYLTILLGLVAILQLLIAYGQYKLGETQVDAAREQTGLESSVWEYEKMRNDRLEARDVEWRREDLEYQKKLPK